MDAAQATLESAFRSCTAALPDILRARKRLQHTSLDQWRELDRIALSHLLSTAPHPEERIATQLSDILPLPSIPPPPLGNPSRILPVTAARAATHALFQGDLTPLLDQGGKGLLLWAPPDDRALGRLMAAFRRYPLPASLGHLRLVVPMELYPGCQSPTAIRDLFFHSLLGTNWPALVRNTHFITHPVGYLTTGLHGPNLLRKGLLVVTVSSLLPRVDPSIPRVLDPLLTANPDLTFLVDFDADDQHVVESSLAGAEVLARARVGRPLRCPTSSRDHPRLRIEVSFPPGTAEVDALLALRHLRRNGLPSTTLYGNKTLYGDRSALLLRTTTPAAAIGAWPLCEQAVLVSPSLAVIKTDSDPQEWRTHMDRMLRDDPTEAILSLRYKPSWEGGQMFASPTATQEQIAATRRTRGILPPAPQPHQLAADIEVGGHLGFDPHQAITMLMHIVARELGTPLRDASREEDAPVSSWRWLAATDPTAPPGRIRLQLASMEQVQLVYDRVHGRAIEMGADLVAISVQNDLLALASLRPGNGRGGPHPTRR